MRTNHPHNSSGPVEARPSPARIARRTLPAAVVLALAAVAPSAVPAAAAPVPFTTCATDATFQVSNVDVDPQPLVRGKRATFRADGTLLESLTGGSYVADFRYQGVSVLQRSGSIDQLIALPAQPGPATLEATAKVPRQAPQGSYELVFSASDQNGAAVTCLRVPFTIG